MSETDQISIRFPSLGRRLGKIALASLPTPVKSVDIAQGSGHRRIAVKRDDLSGTPYGGNKVRKLEYALRPAIDRHKRCIATFGTVGSHHALATALYARQMGFDCTCLLSHQKAAPGIRKTIETHLAAGSRIVRYGGGYADRIATLREHLWGRDAWVVSPGGSSWLGTVGFVNAGLELAMQIEDNELAAPDRIYMATGTMGSAAGLAIGLALGGVHSRLEAVRVAIPSFCNDERMQRLVRKTVSMLRRLDETVPGRLADSVRIRLRHDFFAGGYAHSNAETDAAVEFAKRHMGLHLETTYTGKAMAALLHDLPELTDQRVMFWNTYNSAELPDTGDAGIDFGLLPEEFRRYIR